MTINVPAKYMNLRQVTEVSVRAMDWMRPEKGHYVIGKATAQSWPDGPYPTYLQPGDTYEEILKMCSSAEEAETLAAEYQKWTVFWCANCAHQTQGPPAGHDDEGLPLCGNCI